MSFIFLIDMLILKYVQILCAKKIPCFLLSTYEKNPVDDSHIEEIAAGKYRAMSMSPEIMFGQGTTARKVQKLWVDKLWRERLISIIVDEVHCVEKWAHF